VGFQRILCDAANIAAIKLKTIGYENAWFE
jgi:hypothetical protein